MEYFYHLLENIGEKLLPIKRGETKEDLMRQLESILFDPEVMPKRVNQTDGEDLVLTSACNFYEDVTQEEVEILCQDEEHVQSEPSFIRT